MLAETIYPEYLSSVFPNPWLIALLKGGYQTEQYGSREPEAKTKETYADKAR